MAAYKPRLDWRNLKNLQSINVYKNVPLLERFPNNLRRRFNLGSHENPNAWANNAGAKAMIERILASKKYPAQTRANLYSIYLHNLMFNPTRVAARAEKEKAMARIKEYEERKNASALRPTKRFKLQNNGTWRRTNDRIFVGNTVMTRVTKKHLQQFPYLQRLVIRKNSPRVKGLEMRNNWYYIPYENMKNFPKILNSVRSREQRQLITRGESKAHARLLEVFNRVQRRQHAKNRGQLGGEVLKEQMYGPNRTNTVNIMKISRKRKASSPTANSPGAVARKQANENLKRLYAEHRRLVEEARVQRTGPAHTTRTWARNTGGRIRRISSPRR